MERFSDVDRLENSIKINASTHKYQILSLQITLEINLIITKILKMNDGKEILNKKQRECYQIKKEVLYLFLYRQTPFSSLMSTNAILTTPVRVPCT